MVWGQPGLRLPTPSPTHAQVVSAARFAEHVQTCTECAKGAAHLCTLGHIIESQAAGALPAKISPRTIQILQGLGDDVISYCQWKAP